jgi:hypothetical protein
MKSRLLIFGCFAHNPQSILTAIGRFAFVGVECRLKGPLGVAFKLQIAPFAYASHWPLFDNPQFAFSHEPSLTHRATGAESL